MNSLLSDTKAVCLDDHHLHLICQDKAIEAIIRKRLPAIEEVLENRLHHTFQIKTILADEYVSLYEETEKTDEPDIQSIKEVFPDILIEE